MNLSKRLQAVADLVTPGSCLADVGTDHGYIPIELMKAGRITGAVAMDVNKGPLERATEHIASEQLTERIQTRLSDGLEKLQTQEADAVVIAGMGGALTIQILERGMKVLPSVKELILQPQSEIGRVRCWLAAHDFSIQQETMVQEDGKFYPMMKAVHGRMGSMDELEVLYGPQLLKDKNACLADYLIWEEKVRMQVKEQLMKNRSEHARERLQEVERALQQNRAAQKRIKSGEEY